LESETDKPFFLLSHNPLPCFVLPPCLFPPFTPHLALHSASAQVLVKGDEEAEVDLKRAKSLVPGDAAIENLSRQVQKRREERREKEKKAFSKMFG
jgi:hypothetical protein